MLCIDQLLRAAQLLEQQQTQAAAAALQIGMIGQSQPALQFCKLGEDYEERMVASKMRPCSDSGPGASSTGSSRRSSPISSMFSNCSSAQSASPPNSPSTILLSSMPMPVASSSFQALTQAAGSSNPTVSMNGNGSPASVGSMSTRQSRAAHNELEKNRRANLRGYLDKLKTVLPADVDSTRDTTLSLLTRARNYLRAIHEQKDRLVEQKKAMLAEHMRLCQQLEEGDQAFEVLIPSAKVIEAPLVQEPIQSSSADSPVVAKLSQCFTPPAAFLEQLNLGGGCTPTLALNTKSFASALAEKRVDFYMEGLLPAPKSLPLLYPYTSNQGMCY